MLSINVLLVQLVYLCIFGLVFWVAWWGLHKIQPPFLKVGEVVLILLVCIVLIGWLLGLTGHPLIRW
ncbi:MAG: hypothetical protein A3K30_03945 [Deltaproteobacteria bacterium RBG_13_51_10]|nr:MAG: hypothetical protein A3K30_03945 [Deltaproteobacteria bacterium RBG_13_51_10]